MRLLLTLLVFALDAWAIAGILGSRARTLKKAGWIGVVIALPVAGIVLWRRAAANASTAQ
jgi:hypothetical protein